MLDCSASHPLLLFFLLSFLSQWTKSHTISRLSLPRWFGTGQHRLLLNSSLPQEKASMESARPPLIGQSTVDSSEHARAMFESMSDRGVFLLLFAHLLSLLLSRHS